MEKVNIADWDDCNVSYTYQKRRLRRQHGAESAHHRAETEQAVAQIGGVDLRGEEVQHLEARRYGQLAHQEQDQLQYRLFWPSENRSDATQAASEHQAAEGEPPAEAVHDEKRQEEAGDLHERNVGEIVVLVTVQEHHIEAEPVVDQHVDDPAEGTVGDPPLEVFEGLADRKPALRWLLQLVPVGQDELVQHTLRELALVHLGGLAQDALGPIFLTLAEQPPHALRKDPEIDHQDKRGHVGDTQKDAPVGEGLGEHGQGNLSHSVKDSDDAAGQHSPSRPHQLDPDNEAGGVQRAAGHIVQELEYQEPNIAGRERANSADHGAHYSAQGDRETASITGGEMGNEG